MTDYRAVEKMPKVALVSHIGQWHGNTRNVTPSSQLRKWTKAELDAAHAELHRMWERGTA